MSSGPSSKRRRIHEDDTDGGSKIFTGYRFFIVEAGIGRARRDIFCNQIKKHGGALSDLSECTHVIVTDEMTCDRLLKILKTGFREEVSVIKSKWLSTCLREKKYVDLSDFILSVRSQKTDTTSCSSSSDSTHLNNQNLNTSDSSRNTDDQTDTIELRPDHVSPKGSATNQQERKSNEDKTTGTTCIRPKEAKVNKWVCSKSSSAGETNHNQHITDKLKELASIYDKSNDRWRALGYQKAITTLKKHPKPITSWEEAIKLPGVGKRLADKIWEIVQSGQLTKLEELNADQDTQTLKLFTDVWGAGPTTAQQWIQQGHRSLEDLQQNAELTHNQKVGLKHYEEFLERMPRAEAAEIERTVLEATTTLQPGIVAMACGSYRRGKETCGDVDVLITHPDGESHKGLFTRLLVKLHEDGFLTDDLVTQKDSGNQVKYLGVCKLPGQHSKHRRLDIIVVPYSEFACAQMYFTGSAHFNRSIRNLCKQRGMSLSEHSLNAGVVRKNGVKIHPGYPVPTPTEASVFEHLGLTYRSPAERDH